MTVASDAIEWLRIVAERLGDLREEVVFVGGATVGLLVTDQAAAAVRATRDVDLIVEVGSWGEYAPLQERLREKGFSEDAEEDAPLCRWVVAGIKVDVMPTSEEILGFSNRWYGPAVKTARQVQLTDELSIRLVSAPYFVATKIEAFHGRGKGDYTVSHDIEDLVAVLGGRPALTMEIAQAEDDLRHYLRQEIADLVTNDDFRRALPGHLRGDAASQARLPTILWRLHRIQSDDDEQALLRTILDHIIDEQELPPVKQFRLAHEQHRPLGGLVATTMLKAHRGRYVLTAAGVCRCLPGRAVGEIARCNAIIDELKAMYRSEPEWSWAVKELAKRIDEKEATVERAVTYLSGQPVFRGIDWDPKTGFVKSFSLGERVLDAKHLGAE